jgi:hypothetical protein
LSVVCGSYLAVWKAGPLLPALENAVIMADIAFFFLTFCDGVSVAA